MISLTIPGVPIPWRAPIFGSRGTYSPRTAIMMQMRAILKSSYDGPLLASETVRVELDFYMPIPKGTSKKKRLEMLSGKIRPATRPDRTNLTKFYEDLLQTVVFDDDSQVVGGREDKWYGENPRTEVKIEVIC